MTHKVSAPGLSARPYFNRYTDDAIDLCDVLSSFAPNAKASLHELCRVMGLAGKPLGMDGGEVEKYYRDGRIKEPNIVRAMSLIPIAFGCDMSCFGAK